MLVKLLRLSLVLGSVVAAVASATAPKAQPNLQTTKKTDATYDGAWEAIIDLFASHSWAIKNMDKASGLITTDWMRMDSDWADYTDCGSAPLVTNRGTQVSFNVRVHELESGTQVDVNASFRQLREFDGQQRLVDCVSKGLVEAQIQGAAVTHGPEIDKRRAAKAARAAGSASAADTPRGWYCVSSPSRPEVGACAREKPSCETGRDAAIGAVPDVTSCTLVEVAQCFSAGGRVRCAPTSEACAAQLERAADPAAKCEERP
jgi:hypothetical protein